MLPRPADYIQNERLAGLAYGAALPEQWGVAARNVDFYDVKGDVEALFCAAPVEFCRPHIIRPRIRDVRRASCWMVVPSAGSANCIRNGNNNMIWRKPAVWFEVELDALTQGSVPKAAESLAFPAGAARSGGSGG